jgi:hypothetical protein
MSTSFAARLVEPALLRETLPDDFLEIAYLCADGLAA